MTGIMFVLSGILGISSPLCYSKSINNVFLAQNVLENLIVIAGGGQWLREAGGTLFLCKGGGRFAVLDKGGGRIYSATL